TIVYGVAPTPNAGGGEPMQHMDPESREIAVEEARQGSSAGCVRGSARIQGRGLAWLGICTVGIVGLMVVAFFVLSPLPGRWTRWPSFTRDSFRDAAIQLM